MGCIWGGAPPLGPSILAVGEEAVGMSSREVPSISASSRMLTWDDVSTGWGKSSSLVGRGVTRTMGSSFFGCNSLMHVQMCPILPGIGASSLPWSCWPPLPPLAGEPWQGLHSGRKNDHQGVVLWPLALLQWIVGCPSLGKWVHLQAGLHHWQVTQAGKLS